MNNYYNGPRDQFYYQSPYSNTYDLWQNSRYYDTNNFSLVNYTTNDWNTSEEATVQSTALAKSDNKNRRVVKRDELYKHPERFNNPPGYGWSHQNWVKASESVQNLEQGPSRHVAKYSMTTNKTKLERQLKESLNEPVKMTKAESMMQKMGWQGGALGKTGDGIVEPIAPNAAYATTTAGFGHTKELEKERQKEDEENKEYFNTNVLQTILDFVRNDCELEVEFDKSLWREERKRVHKIVNDVINFECYKYIDTEEQLLLLEQINDCNTYILSTCSQGEVPNRLLVLYKEAPDHVFLITPDDLKEKKDEEEEGEENETADMDIDDSNPFLKSITKNIVEEMNNKMETCKLEKESRKNYNTIVEYFIEFQGKNKYTELRFLGPFNEDETKAVDEFLQDLSKCIDGNYSDVKEDLVESFKENSTCLEILKDVNGTYVVHKGKGEKQSSKEVETS